MNIDRGQVSQLLNAMRAGDAQAAETLLPLVYTELHRLAKTHIRRERPDQTLQASALINEAYLRLVGEDIDWNSRAHFIALAAHVMRRVLVDHARARDAEQGSDGLNLGELQDELAISSQQLHEVAQLDDALSRLGKEKPRQERVVELRYFGGLSVEQTATLLDIPTRSVQREWALARIYLFRELRPETKDAKGGAK